MAVEGEGGGLDGALLFFIEENVKPRDTGTLFAVCAGEVMFEVRNLELFNTNSDSVRHRLRHHARKMGACQFETVAFKNVSAYLQCEIRNELSNLQVSAESAPL